MRTKGDVFDAIFSPEEALVVKFKADLYDAILKVATHYTAKELQIILHEPREAASLAQRLGLEYKGSFPQTHKEVPKRELAMA